MAVLVSFNTDDRIASFNKDDSKNEACKGWQQYLGSTRMRPIISFNKGYRNKNV